MRTNIIYIIVLLILSVFFACDSTNENTEDKLTYKGEYLGLTPVKDSSEVFASGFISTNLYTRDLAIYPTGKEMYFCVSALGLNLIFETKQNSEGIWSSPKPATFIKDFSFMYYEPTISSNGKRLYFLSNMIDTDSIAGDQDIWYVERFEDVWGEPENLGEPVNTAGAEFFPSFTKDNTLYFTRQPEGDKQHYIFRAKYANGEFQEPEKLPDEVNIGDARFNAFISPEEDYIIVPAVGMEDSYGGTDYYIIFRNQEDTWSKAINMGSKINSEAGREYSASLSHDRNFLFFMSDKKSDGEFTDFTLDDLVNKNKEILNGNSNIYWISSDIIQELKSKL